MSGADSEVPKVAYFSLNNPDDWRRSEPNVEVRDGHLPDAVLDEADVLEYFRDGIYTRREQVGSLHLLEVRLAPNFVIPRHHHNFDQLVLVLEGQVRQGRRVFNVGEGYFTKGMTPYTTSAGPEGARYVEIRKDPIDGLETWWDEANPKRWVRAVWDAAADQASAS
jgi:hypothetical protein